MFTYGHVTFIVARPDVSAYDQTYHETHLQTSRAPGAYAKGITNFSMVVHTTEIAKVEKLYLDMDAFYRPYADITIQTCYYLQDVHYYLSDWKPAYFGMVYATGGGFPSIPGHYWLPCDEGWFEISAPR